MNGGCWTESRNTCTHSHTRETQPPTVSRGFFRSIHTDECALRSRRLGRTGGSCHHDRTTGPRRDDSGGGVGRGRREGRERRERVGTVVVVVGGSEEEEEVGREESSWTPLFRFREVEPPSFDPDRPLPRPPLPSRSPSPPCLRRPLRRHGPAAAAPLILSARVHRGQSIGRPGSGPPRRSRGVRSTAPRFRPTGVPVPPCPVTPVRVPGLGVREWGRASSPVLPGVGRRRAAGGRGDPGRRDAGSKRGRRRAAGRGGLRVWVGEGPQPEAPPVRARRPGVEPTGNKSRRGGRRRRHRRRRQQPRRRRRRRYNARTVDARATAPDTHAHATSPERRPGPPPPPPPSRARRSLVFPRARSPSPAGHPLPSRPWPAAVALRGAGRPRLRAGDASGLRPPPLFRGAPGRFRAGMPRRPSAEAGPSPRPTTPTTPPRPSRRKKVAVTPESGSGKAPGFGAE